MTKLLTLFFSSISIIVTAQNTTTNEIIWGEKEDLSLADGYYQNIGGDEDFQYSMKWSSNNKQNQIYQLNRNTLELKKIELNIKWNGLEGRVSFAFFGAKKLFLIEKYFDERKEETFIVMEIFDTKGILESSTLLFEFNTENKSYLNEVTFLEYLNQSIGAIGFATENLNKELIRFCVYHKVGEKDGNHVYDFVLFDEEFNLQNRLQAEIPGKIFFTNNLNSDEITGMYNTVENKPAFFKMNLISNEIVTQEMDLDILGDKTIKDFKLLKHKETYVIYGMYDVEVNDSSYIGAFVGKLTENLSLKEIRTIDVKNPLHLLHKIDDKDKTNYSELEQLYASTPNMFRMNYLVIKENGDLCVPLESYRSFNAQEGTFYENGEVILVNFSFDNKNNWVLSIPKFQKAFVSYMNMISLSTYSFDNNIRLIYNVIPNENGHLFNGAELKKSEKSKRIPMITMVDENGEFTTERLTSEILDYTIIPSEITQIGSEKLILSAYVDIKMADRIFGILKF